MNEMESREAALERFDEGREAFREAVAGAPSESLGYLQPGDDYALGGLLFHANAVLVHYRTVLDAILAAAFAEVTPADPPGLFEVANAKAKAGLDTAERARELAVLDDLHSEVAKRARGVDAADWDRKAPVHYEEGADVYPTSPKDVLGWLTDHYFEHVPHVHQLLDSWRATVR